MNGWLHAISAGVKAHVPHATPVIVTWDKGAKACFTGFNPRGTMVVGCAAPNIFSAGVLLGRAMVAVKKAHPAVRVTCVGHSLGAHVCGMAGKVYSAETPASKIEKIIALDACGPMFDTVFGLATKASNWRLKPSDAVFVHGIHTSSAPTTQRLYHAGTYNPVGHLDVYPGDTATPGDAQPMCAKSFMRTAHLSPADNMKCNHASAYQYLFDSIKNPGHYNVAAGGGRSCGPTTWAPPAGAIKYWGTASLGECKANTRPFKWGFFAEPVAVADAGDDERTLGKDGVVEHIRQVTSRLLPVDKVYDWDLCKPGQASEPVPPTCLAQIGTPITPAIINEADELPAPPPGDTEPAPDAKEFGVAPEAVAK